MTFDDVMNIKLSKCYLPIYAYRDIALDEMCADYDKISRDMHTLITFGGRRRLIKCRNDNIVIQIPKQVYTNIVIYLCEVLHEDRLRCSLFNNLTIGDLYKNIQRLTDVSGIGKDSAKCLYYAFHFLEMELLRCYGIKFDISHWRC